MTITFLRNNVLHRAVRRYSTPGSKWFHHVRIFKEIMHVTHWLYHKPQIHDKPDPMHQLPLNPLPHRSRNILLHLSNLNIDQQKFHLSIKQPHPLIKPQNKNLLQRNSNPSIPQTSNRTGTSAKADFIVIQSSSSAWKSGHLVSAIDAIFSVNQGRNPWTDSYIYHATFSGVSPTVSLLGFPFLIAVPLNSDKS